MRPLGVVIDPPGFDPVPCIGEGEEPAGVKTLGSDAGVEGLDEGIIRGRSWPGEVKLDAVQVGPLVEYAPSELRPLSTRMVSVCRARCKTVRTLTTLKA
jgi:hypothetical protein